ncbi:MAG: mannitol dehydrogenase family protein [Altererythrobacter sp.]|nr:mannitol dehydrogenase family protein [Altererythrobacter sp.]
MEATRDRLAPDAAQPHFDRSQAVGIVHFGIGAFHRAHQAWYTDQVLATGARGWMIAGVSLRSPEVAAQLNPQGGLYTLTERSGDGASTRLIGAVREVLVAGADSAAVVARIASPDCHIVSFTVTEKGYCRAADGSLDRAAAATGFYPLLAEGLARRRDAGLPGLTLLSCDNLGANGRALGRLMREWLAGDHALARWFDAECTVPDTMIDRIVPATTERDREQLAARIGLEDAGAVFAEPFSQWVIEDSFAGPRPRWEDHGVQFVRDVAPYEAAKLRMLNGAHSLLAYCGLAAGHEFVHQAIADPRLRALATGLMVEAAPTIATGEGQDLDAYAADLLARFANPAMRHRLAQIAMDGSQKIPQRWLATLADRSAQGLESPAIEEAMRCWLDHLRGGRDVNDPLAPQLQQLLEGASVTEGWNRVFGPRGMLAAGAAAAE